MNDIEKRLQTCFSLAMPNLPAEAIARASTSSVAEWDSLATVNLLGLIEEEFKVQIPDADLENFTSFELILDYLQVKSHVTRT
jgi:acyl carrier protein